jgi:hypothetical protein
MWPGRICDGCGGKLEARERLAAHQRRERLGEVPGERTDADAKSRGGEGDLDEGTVLEGAEGQLLRKQYSCTHNNPVGGRI